MTATSTRENRWASAGGSTPAGKTGAAPAGKDAPAPEAPKKSKTAIFKSKKFIIAVVVALLVGGGAYKFLAPKKAGPPTGGEVVAMDPTTLNLADGHYLKIAVAIQLVAGGHGTATFSTSHAAELVIDEFSNRSVESLSTNEARKQHTEHLLGAIKQAYHDEVFDVFVTQFVMQ